MFGRLAIPAMVLSLCNPVSGGSQSPASDESRWSVGNGSVERVIRFDAKNGLQTESLRYKLTGRDFLSSAKAGAGSAGEFSFNADGRELSGRNSFTLRGANTSSDTDGNMLQVDLSSIDQSLDVSVFYHSYTDHPALRKWLSVTNRGNKPVYLSHFTFETLAAGPGPGSELEVSGGYGAAPHELFFTGRVSDAAFFIRNATTGEGFAIINEAPGYLKRTEIGSGWSERFSVMYDTDLFPFGRTLAPGETFESAKASLVFFDDNHGLEDSRWAVPRYAAQVVARRHSAGRPPWIYNTWEPFLRGINEQTVKELAPIANEMGLDVFTIDDGWQAEYGANKFDLKRFPNGYAGVKSTLDANHLRLGLWVPLAAISTEVPDYRSHPEWVCRDQSGAPKFTGTAAGSQAVMCLASGYRDLALKRLTQLIEHYHPAYIKVDLTTVFNAYGEQPGCYAKNHAHRDWAESLTRIYEALEYIGKQLYRSHPEVLVDYTFELWGEKHLIDAALLGCADLDWLSNVKDTDTDAGGPLNARTLLYTRSPSIPAEAMLIGNLRAPTPTIEERFATEIGSGPLFLGDLRKLSKEERGWYAEKIRWFKDLRGRIPLNESFIPLGSWRQPNIASWDGFARFGRDSGGIVVVFKNKSGVDSVDIHLPAPAGITYRAKSIMTGQDIGIVRGGDLVKGWKLSLPANHPVEIVEFQKQGS